MAMPYEENPNSNTNQEPSPNSPYNTTSHSQQAHQAPQPQQPQAYQAPQPQQPQAYYGPPPSQPVQQPISPGSGKATAAVVCGILAIVFSWTIVFGIALGIVAIVLATQHIKASGPSGKTKGGRICGIIGIALSVISIFVYIASFGFILYMLDSSAGTGTSSKTEIEIIDNTFGGEADRKELTDYSEQLVRSLKNLTQEEVDGIAVAYNEQFALATGFPLTEAGVDPTSIVRTSMDSISYKPGEIYFTDDGAVGYASVTCYGIWDYLAAMSAETARLLEGGRAPLLGADSPDKVWMGEVFLDQMDAASPHDHLIEFKYTKADGVWEVDAESYNDAAEYIFQIYD